MNVKTVRNHKERKKMQFEELKGKTLIAIAGGIDDEEMIFVDSEGCRYRLYHYQSCCEWVRIADITGDTSDLLMHPILSAEEVIHEDSVNPEGVTVESSRPEYFTWTFYKIATIKGSVTLRWLGESNGCYSEAVSFEVMK